MRKKAFNIPGIDQSLKKDFENGKITIDEVALEYHKAGFTNEIDIDYAKRMMKKEPISKKHLKQLQMLCHKVNRRYAKGLNDDDQVAAMFKFEKSISDCRVIIGWDDYQAMTIEQLEEEYKTAKEITPDEFYITKNHRQYKCRLPIRKY